MERRNNSRKRVSHYAKSSNQKQAYEQDAYDDYDQYLDEYDSQGRGHQLTQVSYNKKDNYDSYDGYDNSKSKYEQDPYADDLYQESAHDSYQNQPTRNNSARDNRPHRSDSGASRGQRDNRRDVGKKDSQRSGGGSSQRSQKMKKCAECGYAIERPPDGFEIEALKQWFHVDCFCCNVCKRPFDDNNPYVPHEGKAFCEHDYEQQFLSVCAACQKPITDGKISHAFGRIFHERHLRCSICKHRIQGPHVEHNGKAFCQKDFDYFISQNCQKCNQPIRDGGVHACGGVYHRNCFGCTVCSKGFPDKKFYVFDGLPFCLEHYHEASNTLCGYCREPIEGQCVDAQELDLKFHIECWTCADCGMQLDDVYYSFQGNAYCENDIENSGGGARPQKRHTMTRDSSAYW